MNNKYITYIIRCEDNSLYTGITNNLDRRMNEHFNKTEKGAKYTHSHQMKKIEKVWISNSRSLASKLEYNIKKLTKSDKELLIKDDKYFEKIFSRILKCNEYKVKLN